MQFVRDCFDDLTSGAHREIDRRGACGFADYVQMRDVGLIGVIDRGYFARGLRSNAGDYLLRRLLTRQQANPSHRRARENHTGDDSDPPRRQLRATQRNQRRAGIARRSQVGYIQAQCESRFPVRRELRRGARKILQRYHSVRMKKMTFAASDHGFFRGDRIFSSERNAFRPISTS